MEIANQEPNLICAGDLIQWRKSLSLYPAGTWTLSYTLINAHNKIDITATASGTDHLVNVAAATSATWPPGTYKVQGYVTNGSQRFTITQDEITIKPNFAAASTLDTRSHVKKVLEALEAVLEGKATSDQMEYSIGGRSIKRMPITDLMVWRDKYRAQYLSEQRAEGLAKGLGGKNMILVRL